MLVLTGIMLGFVLEIMVGEQINEMQLAHWIPTHTFPLHIPAWTGTWFSLFNNSETVNALLHLLHDGWTRSNLRHDDKAEPFTGYVKKLNSSKQDALIAFLHSL